MDDFEQRLKRQPLRQLPADWREGILAAAKAVEPADHRSRTAHPSFLSTLNHQLSTLLWPHPKAWAGLAAVWIVIVTMNMSMRESAPAVMAKKASPPSSEMMAELKQQRLMYAQLIGGGDQPADRPKFFPMPRSGRVGMMMT